MPTALHPDDPAFHRMVAAYEGEPDLWVAVNQALRDAMVAYAAERSPYYRSVAPPEMAFDDIPILTKEIIRERHDELIADGVPRDRWWPSRTSGTSGRPTNFLRDTAQGYLENISALRFLKWAQAIPPDAATVWVSASPPSPAPGIHPVATGTLTPELLERELRAWDRLGTYFLYGFASAIDWMAQQVERRGLAVPPPVCVVTTSETLSENARARIQQAFGVPVHSWYGSREMNGFVAGTLPGTRRYAVNPFLVHLEILDAHGRPVPTGRMGRIVLTDLNNLVMPFVRYDTGDLAVLSVEGTVGGFPLIEEVVGRASEVIELPSGKTLSATTLSQTVFTIHGFWREIDSFQCLKVGPNAIDFRVLWSRPPTRERVARLADAVRSAADPDTLVTIRRLTEVERLPSGKVWLLRDQTREAGIDQPARSS